MSTFLGIMVFYMILSYIIGPALFYYFYGKTLAAAGNGFVIGSILSLILWFVVGKSMIKG